MAQRFVAVIALLTVAVAAVVSSTAAESVDGAIYINCGDSRDVEHDGKIWKSDREFAPGGQIVRSRSALEYSAPSIYDTMRSFEGVDYAIYTVDVNASTYYMVSLHFSSTDRRITAPAIGFNAYIQDAFVLNMFAPDYYKSLDPMVRSFYTPSDANGKITITFERGNDSIAVISAIEIVPRAGLYSVDPASGYVLTSRYNLDIGTNSEYGPDKVGRMWYSPYKYLNSIVTLIDYRAPANKSQISGTEVAPMYLPLEVYLTATYVENARIFVPNPREELTYGFATEKGTRFFIRFHFAQLRVGKDEDFLLNILINGKPLVKGLNVTAVAGDFTALVQDFIFETTTERMELTVSGTEIGTDQRCFLNALEVLHIMPFANMTTKAIAMAKAIDNGASTSPPPSPSIAPAAATPNPATSDASGQPSPGATSSGKAGTLWTGVAVGVVAVAALFAAVYAGLILTGNTVSVKSRRDFEEADLEAIKLGGNLGSDMRNAPQGAVPAKAAVPRDTSGRPLLTHP